MSCGGRSEKSIWSNKPHLEVDGDGHLKLHHRNRSERIRPEFDEEGEKVLIGCTVVSFDAVLEVAALMARSRRRKEIT